MTTPSGDDRKRPDARLLVVEDEPNILELLSASLRYAGFEVITASAGGQQFQDVRLILDNEQPGIGPLPVIARWSGHMAIIQEQPECFLKANWA